MKGFANMQAWQKGVAIGIAAMAVIVAASNYLVQFPINVLVLHAETWRRLR